MICHTQPAAGAFEYADHLGGSTGILVNHYRGQNAQRNSGDSTRPCGMRAASPASPRASRPLARFEPDPRGEERQLGTQGYCMGGPIALRTAAAVPERVGAVASFHGGGLVTDTPNSPHLQAAKSKAQFLIAIAANDDMRSPNDKTVLKETFAKANLPAEIEVYTGAAHGWCPPDSQVYNEPQAEKAWSRLLALYGKALA